MTIVQYTLTYILKDGSRFTSTPGTFDELEEGQAKIEILDALYKREVLAHFITCQENASTSAMTMAIPVHSISYISVNVTKLNPEPEPPTMSKCRHCHLAIKQVEIPALGGSIWVHTEGWTNYNYTHAVGQEACEPDMQSLYATPE